MIIFNHTVLPSRLVAFNVITFADYLPKRFVDQRVAARTLQTKLRAVLDRLAVDRIALDRGSRTVRQRHEGKQCISALPFRSRIGF